jgi:hypothetical protein
MVVRPAKAGIPPPLEVSGGGIPGMGRRGGIFELYGYSLYTTKLKY